MTEESSLLDQPPNLRQSDVWEGKEKVKLLRHVERMPAVLESLVQTGHIFLIG